MNPPSSAAGTSSGQAWQGGGSVKDNQGSVYTPEDIRFTAKGKTLYAILMSWSEGPVLISSLDAAHVRGLEVESVEMLGSSETLVWNLSEKGLEVNLPKEKPCDYAYVLRIELRGQVLSDTEVYYIERDSSTPQTADTYVYNHSESAVPLTLEVLWRGQPFETHRIDVPAASSIRIQSDISACPEAVTAPIQLTNHLL